MESVNCMTASKLDFPKGIIDLKHGYEAQARDFVDPVSYFPHNMESFRNFPNAIESVKRSSISQVPDPLVEIDSFENSGHACVDVTECEPELVVCYKESSYHIIKDICVDEGGTTMDKTSFESSVDEKAYNFFPSWSYESKEMMKDNTGINVVNISALEESAQVSANDDQSKDLMQKDEDATEKLADNVYREMVVPGDKVLLQGFHTGKSRPSDDLGDEIEHSHAQVAGEPELHSQPDKSKNMIEEADFAGSALELAGDESNIDILDTDGMLLKNGSITYQFDPSASAACGKDEWHQVGSFNRIEAENTSKPAKGKSDDQVVTSQFRQSLGESSFSAVGLVSSHMSYSGPVPYSGSISLRSDSSTTSTRSFAFPILQSEWNSSPVRMAKADRRHYRKQRGCSLGRLCCRF